MIDNPLTACQRKAYALFNCCRCARREWCDKARQIRNDKVDASLAGLAEEDGLPQECPDRETHIQIIHQ